MFDGFPTLTVTANSLVSRFSSGPLIVFSGREMALASLTSSPCFRIAARMCHGSRVQAWFRLMTIGKQSRDKRGMALREMMKMLVGQLIHLFKSHYLTTVVLIIFNTSLRLVLDGFDKPDKRIKAVLTLTAIH